MKVRLAYFIELMRLIARLKSERKTMGTGMSVDGRLNA